MPAITSPSLTWFEMWTMRISFDKFLTHNPQVEKLKNFHSCKVIEIIATKLPNIHTLFLDFKHQIIRDTSVIWKNSIIQSFSEFELAITMKDIRDILPLKNIACLEINKGVLHIQQQHRTWYLWSGSFHWIVTKAMPSQNRWYFLRWFYLLEQNHNSIA